MGRLDLRDVWRDEDDDPRQNPVITPEIRARIAAVRAGEPVEGKPVFSARDEESLPRAVVPEGEISAREREVLILVAEGHSNREIGEELFIAEETVKTHVRHLLAKIGARTRAHAVALAADRGLIELQGR